MRKFLSVTIVLLLTLGAILIGGRIRYDRTHVTIDGIDYDCNITQLTLSGTELPDPEALNRLPELETLDIRSVPVTIDQYEQLRRNYPQYTILWLVPFQGERISPDITELTLSVISKEDLDTLSYFPNLKTIRAEGCRDYDMIELLKNQRPDLDVIYAIALDGQLYAPDITHLALDSVNGQEVLNVLPYLHHLQQLSFTGILPESTDLRAMMEQYPEIEFLWTLSVFGIEIPNTETNLDLSGIAMDATQLESIVEYLPKLERVDVCDCGILSADMDPLTQRYPDIRFIWTIKIGNGTLRTDAIAFIPYKLGYHIYKPLYDADCTELKYCVDLICLDLGHMKITDLSFLQYMPKMKYLIVADIPCQDFSVIGELTELIYLEIFVTSFTQHEILLNLTKLEDLNIGTTPANDITALKQMTWLKRLWLPGTKLNYLQVAELKEALPKTRIMVYADHSTDKGWRQAKNYYDMRDLLGMFYME